MKLLQVAALVGGLGGSSFAQAGSITCVGNHLGYQFGVQTRTQGDRVSGNVNVNISQGGRSVKRSALTPTSSDIRENQYLRFSASGADGSGTLNASYAGGGYSGTLVARTNYGTFNVSVNCQLNGSSLQNGETPTYW